MENSHAIPDDEGRAVHETDPDEGASNSDPSEGSVVPNEDIETINLKRKVSGEVPEEDDMPKIKFARFEATPVQNNSWELPKDITDYVHEHLKKFLTDKDIKQPILADNPIPENVKH